MSVQDFILASASPQRKKLLLQIGLTPEKIIAADIDERERKYERPAAYVKRMAREKALKVAAENPGKIVLGADTVVTVGCRILHKAKNDDEQRRVMELLSGRSHRVLSAVCVVGRDGKCAERFVSTRICMKKMSEEEIAAYVAGHEWQGCSGYKIEGVMESYVSKIVGSYSGVVGLPLCETKKLLNGVGIK